MNIAITGSKGYVGSALVKALMPTKYRSYKYRLYLYDLYLYDHINIIYIYMII